MFILFREVVSVGEGRKDAHQYMIQGEGQRLHDEKQNAIRESQIRKAKEAAEKAARAKVARDADSAREELFRRDHLITIDVNDAKKSLYVTHINS